MRFQKTVAVFRGAKTWLRFGAVCLVLVLGATAARYDILGLYSRVPEVDDISYIDLSYLGEARSRSELEAVTDFQKLAIARRKENEAAGAANVTPVRFTYYLKDGSALSYCYRLADNEAAQKDPDSLICRYDALLNSESMVLRRNAIPEEFCRDDSGFVYCSIEDYGSQSMADAALPAICPAMRHSRSTRPASFPISRTQSSAKRISPPSHRKQRCLTLPPSTSRSFSIRQTSRSMLT